jgi:hypothetical protein
MENYTVIDGMKWDGETGECLGPVDSAFEIRDEASFEWVMEQVQKLEFEIKRREQIEANAKVGVQQAKARLGSFLYRFSGELENYARENLPSGKKSLSCQYGKVAFRATKPTWEVVDEDAAVRWAANNCPTAVKTKFSLLKSEIPVTLGSVPGLQLNPGGDKVSITGEV